MGHGGAQAGLGCRLLLAKLRCRGRRGDGAQTESNYVCSPIWSSPGCRGAIGVNSARSGFKSISAKILDNTVVNAEAAFDAARAIARADTITEALRLQTEFVQRQFTLAGAQTKELFELSTRVATNAFEQASEATTKTVDKARKRA